MECIQTNPVERVGNLGDTQFCLALIQAIREGLQLEPGEALPGELVKSIPEVLVCPKSGDMV